MAYTRTHARTHAPPTDLTRLLLLRRPLHRLRRSGLRNESRSSRTEVLEEEERQRTEREVLIKSLSLSLSLALALALCAARQSASQLRELCAQGGRRFVG